MGKHCHILWFGKGMEKMSDSVQIILILCITYVVGMIISKWKPIQGNQKPQQKDGVKK